MEHVKLQWMFVYSIFKVLFAERLGIVEETLVPAFPLEQSQLPAHVVYLVRSFKSFIMLEHLSSQFKFMLNFFS